MENDIDIAQLENYCENMYTRGLLKFKYYDFATYDKGQHVFNPEDQFWCIFVLDIFQYIFEKLANTGKYPMASKYSKLVRFLRQGKYNILNLTTNLEDSSYDTYFQNYYSVIQSIGTYILNQFQNFSEESIFAHVKTMFLMSLQNVCNYVGYACNCTFDIPFVVSYRGQDLDIPNEIRTLDNILQAARIQYQRRQARSMPLEFVTVPSNGTDAVSLDDILPYELMINFDTQNEPTELEFGRYYTLDTFRSLNMKNPFTKETISPNGVVMYLANPIGFPTGGQSRNLKLNR